MKKNIILLITGVLGGLGLYLYKKKDKKEEDFTDARSLENNNNDYVVYSDEDEEAPKGDGMFI